MAENGSNMVSVPATGQGKYESDAEGVEGEEDEGDDGGDDDDDDDNDDDNDNEEEEDEPSNGVDGGSVSGSWSSETQDNSKNAPEAGLDEAVEGEEDDTEATQSTEDDDAGDEEAADAEASTGVGRQEKAENGVVDLLPGLCKLLETWLVQVVFPRSRDMQEINSEESDGLVGKDFNLGIYKKDTTIMLTSVGVAVFVLAAVSLVLFRKKTRISLWGHGGCFYSEEYNFK